MNKPDGCSADQLPKHSPSTPQSNRADLSATQNPNWREVAALASTETNPQKLAELVDNLIRLLDEERRSKGLRPFDKDEL